MGSIDLTVPLLVQGKRLLVLLVLSLVFSLLPVPVGSRLATQGLTVKARGQVLVGDGHGAAVATHGRGGQFVLAVDVRVVEDGRVVVHCHVVVGGEECGAFGVDGGGCVGNVDGFGELGAGVGEGGVVVGACEERRGGEDGFAAAGWS